MEGNRRRLVGNCQPTGPPHVPPMGQTAGARAPSVPPPPPPSVLLRCCWSGGIAACPLALDDVAEQEAVHFEPRKPGHPQVARHVREGALALRFLFPPAASGRAVAVLPEAREVVLFGGHRDDLRDLFPHIDGPPPPHAAVTATAYSSEVFCLDLEALRWRCSAAPAAEALTRPLGPPVPRLPPKGAPSARGAAFSASAILEPNGGCTQVWGLGACVVLPPGGWPRAIDGAPPCARTTRGNVVRRSGRGTGIAVRKVVKIQRHADLSDGSVGGVRIRGTTPCAAGPHDVAHGDLPEINGHSHAVPSVRPVRHRFGVVTSAQEVRLHKMQSPNTDWPCDSVPAPRHQRSRVPRALGPSPHAVWHAL